MKARAGQVGQHLDEIQRAITDCHIALAEDPGCVDPDRTMVPFEDLRGSCRRLFGAVGSSQPPASTEGDK